MAGMTIGTLAKKGGVGVETIRFYQRRDLLPTPPKGDGVRRYGTEDLKRLRFIRSAQQAGFTLTQIGELIGWDEREDRARVLEMATARLTEIDARIRELENVREALRGLTQSCAAGDGEACPILQAFEA